MGYVYIIEAPQSKRVKIGKTINIDERLKSLQTGCPEKFGRIWKSIDSEDYSWAERFLHSWFEDKNESGEWFNVQFDEAVKEAEYIITRCNEKMMKHYKEVLEENHELRIRNDLLESQKRIMSKCCSNCEKMKFLQSVCGE